MKARDCVACGLEQNPPQLPAPLLYHFFAPARKGQLGYGSHSDMQHGQMSGAGPHVQLQSGFEEDEQEGELAAAGTGSSTWSLY